MFAQYFDHPDFESEIERVLCEKSFIEFVKKAWEIVDHEPFMPAWHVECICAHMEAFRRHDFNIGVINIPPGHAKSLLISVLFPAWVWATEPHIRFLTGSYNMELAIRDTLKSRRLIESPWYQKHWGNVFQLTGDQNTKGNYVNDRFGYRIAFASTGGTTGHRGDFILLDDAMSVKQSESQVEREGINTFLGQTLFNRQNIVKETGIMGIGQRLHPNDYHKVLLSFPNCFHLVLQEEFQPENAFSSPYYKDPRTKQDEPLWDIPKFSPNGLKLFKIALGKSGYSAQYQQRPLIQEGSILKRTDWSFYDKKSIAGQPGRIILAWDCAAKEKERNDYTVCLVTKKIGHKFYILHLFRQKIQFPELKRQFIKLAEEYKPQVIYIEDASNGTPLIQEMKQTRFKTKINPIRIENNVKIDPGKTGGRDKEARVNPITPVIEAGWVFIPDDAEWKETFLDECAAFPLGDHDDIVDAVALTLNNERVKFVHEIAFV